MRRALRVLSWVLAVLASASEAALLWVWLRGMLYLRKFGAAENLRAAEEASTAGWFALALLPLAAGLLAWAMWNTVRNNGGRPPDEEI